jgi:hypothetical protein
MRSVRREREVAEPARSNDAGRLRLLAAALVVASVALLVALGGTSYAVSTLPANSVGSAQLRTGAVTSAKARTGPCERWISLPLRDEPLPARVNAVCAAAR